MAKRKNKKSQAKHKQIQEKAIKENDLYRETCKMPRKKLILTLPIAPSINHIYVNTKNGGRRLSSSAKDYFTTATAIINQAAEEQKWIIENDYIWYYLDICIYMPNRRIRDSHNMLKILIDTLQGSVIKNDYYILPRIQKVEYDADNPRIEMCLHKQLEKDRGRDYM